MYRPSPTATRQLGVGRLLTYVSIASVRSGAMRGACWMRQLARSGAMRQIARDAILTLVRPRTGLGRIDLRFGRSDDEGWRLR